MPSDYFVEVLVLLIVCGFFALLVTTSYFERRMINPYVEIDRKTCMDPLEPFYLSDYVEHMSDGAFRNGYQFGSVFLHAKYPVAGVIWISDDRSTLMITGSGAVIGIPTKQTWFISPLSDGKWLITTDQNDEGDATGLELIKRRLNVKFDPLFDEHTRRIQSNPLVVPFPPGCAFDVLLARARTKYESLIQRGSARYRDAEQTMWSYSFFESLKAIPRFFTQLGGALLQPHRVNLPAIASVTRDIPASRLIRKWSNAAEELESEPV